MKHSFRVGNHIFSIDAPTSINLFSLLPSLQRFSLPPNQKAPLEENLLFSLSITADETLGGSMTREQRLQISVPPKEAEEVLTFDWDDADCTISKTNAHYYIQTSPHRVTSSAEEVDSTWYIRTDLDFKHGTTFLKKDERNGFVMNNFLMMLYAFNGASKDTLLMHASVIEMNGEGYMFLGKSGTGKSTHTALWLRHFPGALRLNDDNPVVRISPDGQPLVYGSPWSGKTPCYRNAQVSLKGIVRLHQAPYNKIQREMTVPAFASILPSCSILKQDKKLYDALCNVVGKVAQLVPTYHLECLPDEAAARLAYDTITKAK